MTVIPAQRAAEAFSSAVLWLYARDHRLLISVASLSALTLISLLLGSGSPLGLSPRYATAAQILIVGVALDVVRQFYARTLELLDPSTALKLIKGQCFRYIMRLTTRVHRLTRIHSILLRNDNPAALAGWHYATLPGLGQPLLRWIDQLEEFALKAVARDDTHATVAAINTMASIGNRYADARRDSIVLQPDFAAVIPIQVSDVGNILDPIYNALSRICENGIAKRNEAVVKATLHSMGVMANYMAGVVHVNSAPLLYTVAFYLRLITQKASDAGMEDALLRAIACLEELLHQISNDVDFAHADEEVIACLDYVARASYGRPSSVVCFPAVKAMLLGAKRILETKGYEQPTIVEDILNRVRSLVPLEVIAETAGRPGLAVFPPYDAGFEANIAALLSIVAQRVEPVDPERNWVDPFDEFVEASEDFVHHYRSIADEVPLGRALIRTWILNSIIAAAGVHRDLIANPPVGSEAHVDVVENRLDGFIHAPSFFFRGAADFEARGMEEISADLAVLAMHLMRLQRRQSAIACGASISNIARSAMALQVRPPRVARALRNLELLARAADALGFAAEAVGFRQQIDPDRYLQASYPDVWASLQDRLGRLDEEIARRGAHVRIGADPMQALREILQFANPEPNA